MQMPLFCLCKHLCFVIFIVNNSYNIGENLKNWTNVVILCVVFL